MRRNKSDQQPQRDYRCVRYRDCLTRAAHKNHGVIGFDCAACGKFEEKTDPMVIGIDTERYSVGYRKKCSPIDR